MRQGSYFFSYRKRKGPGRIPAFLYGSCCVWGMDSGLHQYGEMQVKRFCWMSLLVPTSTSMTTTGVLYGNFGHCVTFK